MADDAPKKKRKSKPMSTAMRRFLKKHGRFPKKGELKRARSRSRSKKSKRKSDRRTKRSVRGKKDYVFTAARRRAAVRNLKHGRSKRRRSSPRRRTSHRRRRSRSRKGIRRRSRSGGVSLG
jgi:hypothetical protein